MKKVFQILFVVMLVSSFPSKITCAQDSTSTVPQLDKSPLDLSYYPDNFPLMKMQDKAAMPLKAKLTYSRPQLNGRVIFGNLVEYGKVWRLGANECTQIEFFTNVYINKILVKKGIYSMYAIPEEKSWTFIINKETDSWGSFRYDITKDVVRVKVPVVQLENSIENFSMFFKPVKSGFQMIATWDKIQVSLPFSF